MTTHDSPASEARSAATGFRLIAVEGGGGGERAVAVGATVELAPGVVLRLADEHGNAMIERTSAEAPDVAIEGQPVYEVAHYRAMQELRIGRTELVLLPPYGVFARRTENRSGKVARMQALLGAPVLSESVVPLHRHPRVVAMAPVETVAAPQRVQAPRKARKPRRLLLAVIAVPVVALTGLALMPPLKSPSIVRPEEERAAQAATAPERPAAKQKKVETREPTEVVETATVKTGDDPQAAQPKAEEPESAAESDVATEPSPVGEPKAAGPKPVAKRRTAEASRPATPKPPHAAAATAAAPKDAAPAGVALDPKREQAVRSQIESYQLEAGFDPDGARRKLRALRDSLPARARIRADVDKALRAITN